MNRLLNIGLLIAFQFCYLEWPNHSMFVYQVEYEIFAKAENLLTNITHPIILLGLINQILLLLGAFLSNFSKKIKFINRDYSQTENHRTVFPIGAFYGLKDFFNYKYLTAENVISYNDELESKKLLKLDSVLKSMLGLT